MNRNFFKKIDGRWVAVSEQDFRRARGEPVPPTSGLGDLVAAVAQPIARAIDAVAGTKLAECGGCKKRRAALNRIRL